MVGSGLKHNELFLGQALREGIQVVAGIRLAGQTACILLVGQKNDNSQYSRQDLDYFSILCNIASLAMDNIHQYSTIEKLSYTDSMTGVFNYRYFYKRLGEEILRARRYNRELALVILDIDNFKSFNDNYGHQAGDFVLKHLSDLITKTIRSIDIVSRYGGEEFCIIMPDTGTNNCEIFIERLRSQIAEFKFESKLFPEPVSISVSVGGAVYPYHGSVPDRLIYCADMALLKAKSLGRNRSIMFLMEFAGDADSMKGSINESRREPIS
jgi:diguanylate cyclase (GGDEF)-like protein